MPFIRTLPQLETCCFCLNINFFVIFIAIVAIIYGFCRCVTYLVEPCETIFSASGYLKWPLIIVLVILTISGVLVILSAIAYIVGIYYTRNPKHGKPFIILLLILPCMDLVYDITSTARIIIDTLPCNVGMIDPHRRCPTCQYILSTLLTQILWGALMIYFAFVANSYNFVNALHDHRTFYKRMFSQHYTSRNQASISDTRSNHLKNAMDKESLRRGEITEFRIITESTTELTTRKEILKPNTTEGSRSLLRIA